MKIQSGNQKPYIEGQTTQMPKIKRINNDPHKMLRNETEIAVCVVSLISSFKVY